MKMLPRRFYNRKTFKQELFYGEVYDSLDECIAKEASGFKGFLKWSDLPKYKDRKECRKYGDVIEHKLSTMEPDGKWIEGSDGRVVKILGIYRKKRWGVSLKNQKLGELEKVFIDTIYGRTELLEDELLIEREWPGKFVDYRRRRLVEAVAATRSFVGGLTLCYPNIVKKAEGDKFKMLEIAHRRYLFNYEFFYYLRLLMSENEIQNAIDLELPIKEAVETLKNLMESAADEKVREKAAEFIVEKHLELKNPKQKEAPKFPSIGTLPPPIGMEKLENKNDFSTVPSFEVQN